MPKNSPDITEPDIIEMIITSLKSMDRRFTDLSKLRFNELSDELKEKLLEQKIQERPFAYEFYHQIRKYWDTKNTGDLVIQAEVNKGYQRIRNLNRIPDFIIHTPNTNNNIAVLEFKVVRDENSTLESIKRDFEKLVDFYVILNYKHLVEVLIGNSEELEKIMNKIEELSEVEVVNENKGEKDFPQITTIFFSIDKWNIIKIVHYKYNRKYNLPS